MVLQLLQKLQQKRTALEKELSKVPGAPSSKKDVFHLCRGFERAFTHLLEVHHPMPYIDFLLMTIRGWISLEPQGCM